MGTVAIICENVSIVSQGPAFRPRELVGDVVVDEGEDDTVTTLPGQVAHVDEAEAAEFCAIHFGALALSTRLTLKAIADRDRELAERSRGSLPGVPRTEIRHGPVEVPDKILTSRRCAGGNGCPGQSRGTIAA